MNLKQRLLSAMTLSITAAILVATNYSSAAQAQETTLPRLDQSSSVRQLCDSDQTDAISSWAIYSLADPALQFIYSPDQYVVELSSPSARRDREGAAISAIALWSKRDYLALKNAGNEIGDFPTRLTVSVYGNPEGIPLEDWISGLSDAVLPGNGGTLERSPIAGGEGIIFTREQAAISYQNIALKDTTGDRVIMISVGGFRGSNQSDEYASAFDKLTSSLRLTSASVDKYELEQQTAAG